MPEKTEAYTLGIDIGTTSTKGVVLDENIRIVAKARTERSVINPAPGFAEQDARTWWQGVLDIIRELSLQADLKNVKAVGISSMCPTVLPVSESGEPLRNAILYGIDSRATEECSFLNRELAEQLPAKIYTSYTSQSVLPKLLWIKKNNPDVFKKTSYFLTTSGYAVYKLTGRPVVDMFTASAGNLVDLNTMKWFGKGMEKAGISEKLLPELLWPNSAAGTVTASAAAETGLPEGIPVTAGMCDAAADALSCGALNPGNTAVSLGGTTICVACADKPLFLENLFINTHFLPGRYMYGGATGSGGILLEWLAEKVFGTTPSEMFSRYAGLQYRPVPGIFLPYLNGARTPRNNPEARGIFTGIGINTDREEIYISVLEALAFDLADMVNEIERNGLAVNQVHVSGGGTGNRLLLQIISEVLERDITAVAGSFDASAAAAVTASALTGKSELENICKSIPGEVIEYSGKYRAYLEKKRRLFSEVYSANQKLFTELHSLNTGRD